MGFRPAPWLHTLVITVLTSKMSWKCEDAIKMIFYMLDPLPSKTIVKGQKAEAAVENEKVPYDKQLLTT